MAVSVFCLVRALPGMLVGGKDALTVTSVQQLGTLDLRHNDELVSHVFRLDGTAKDPNAKVSKNTAVSPARSRFAVVSFMNTNTESSAGLTMIQVVHVYQAVVT